MIMVMTIILVVVIKSASTSLPGTVFYLGGSEFLSSCPQVYLSPPVTSCGQPYPLSSVILLIHGPHLTVKGRSPDKNWSSFGFCPNHLPPSPQFGQLVQLFSDVEIQDLKVRRGLKILYIIYVKKQKKLA